MGIAVCLIILLVGLGLAGLHYKKKLPASFYNLCNRRWKPVNTEDLVGDEEDRHPSIIKNGGLDETALTEAGEVNVNNDMTTVTWTSDEKEDLKKADTKEEKVTKEEKEPEKEARRKPRRRSRRRPRRKGRRKR